MRDVRNSKDRAWREVAAIDAAYERGELDDEGWHRAMAEHIVPAYLAGDVRRGSGHTGTASDWEYSRGIVAELIERDRALTFLDVGCANGLMMESIDVVRTGLEHVPRPRRRELVEGLLAFTDLLIVGKSNEELEDRATERDLQAWGFRIVRTVERAHRSDPRICYRAIAVR